MQKMGFNIFNIVVAVGLISCNHSGKTGLAEGGGRYSSDCKSGFPLNELFRSVHGAGAKKGFSGISDILLILENYKMDDRNRKLNLKRLVKNIDVFKFPFHKMSLLKDSIATRDNVIASLQYKRKLLYSLIDILKMLNLDDSSSNEAMLANNFVLLLEKVSDLTLQLIYEDFNGACLDRLKNSTDRELVFVIYKRLMSRKLLLNSFEFIINDLVENMDSLKAKSVDKEYVLNTFNKLVGNDNVLLSVFEGMQDRV
ncbi:uncharacterized conserved protein (plasmid) [Borrelia recurrentis A1]|uniref:Uncharacterized conserved protein n=2 Tax=Borrelia recurrentis TaxID=44449 RepID=B5RRW2_BORRA|nr:uncharacterized conserved protein [Borrelia recurrentis A1]